MCFIIRSENFVSGLKTFFDELGGKRIVCHVTSVGAEKGALRVQERQAVCTYLTRPAGMV